MQQLRFIEDNHKESSTIAVRQCKNASLWILLDFHSFYIFTLDIKIKHALVLFDMVYVHRILGVIGFRKADHLFVIIAQNHVHNIKRCFENLLLSHAQKHRFLVLIALVVVS